MKIAKGLQPGDRVDVSVTHEVKIGKETSWIKYGVNTAVQTGETAEDARKRASELVNEGVLQTVVETVETVRKFNEVR